MTYSNDLKLNLYHPQYLVIQKSKVFLHTLLLFASRFQRLSDGFVGRIGKVKLKCKNLSAVL